MLIIPVLITVIDNFASFGNQEFQRLFENVIEKLEDDNPSVLKTAKRLLLEL